jgi:hypothetical protein
MSDAMIEKCKLAWKARLVHNIESIRKKVIDVVVVAIS